MLNTNKLARLLSITAVLAVAQGCTSLGVGESDFACKGYPDGLRCMSAQDVYEITNEDDYKERIAEVAARQGGDAERGVNKIPEEGGVPVEDRTGGGSIHTSARSGHMDMNMMPVQRQVIPKETSETIPLRTPAQVMRVYVSAWESKSGDLNVPSYVYTEIEPRRWMIGTRHVEVNESLKPLQTKTEALPNSGGDIGQAGRVRSDRLDEAASMMNR